MVGYQMTWWQNFISVGINTGIGFAGGWFIHKRNARYNLRHFLNWLNEEKGALREGFSIDHLIKDWFKWLMG